jgi:hypothetical protein
MIENQQGKTVRGTGKKGGKRKKAPSQGASKNAAAPQQTAPQGSTEKAAARKKPAPRRTSKKIAPMGEISAEERYCMIQRAAYLRAEKQSFNCDPCRCWLDAEAEIDALLASSSR